MKILRGAVLTSAAMATALAATSCSSSSTPTSTGSSPPSTSNSAPASTTTIPVPPSAPQTAIGVSTKLNKVPPKKTVGWLQCSLPGCTSFTPGFKEATKALGWTLKTITFTAGQPAPAMQQAINDGVDYIAITGVPYSLIATQLVEAKAKGIPVISADDVGLARPNNDLLTQFGGPGQITQESTQIGEWILHDVGATKAHILDINIPDIPEVQAGYPALKTTISKYCPSGCTVDELGLTVTDLAGGKVASKLVSYLQTHPDINYLDFAFADPMVGVIPVLKTAGLLSKLKIVGQNLGAAPEVISGIKDGTVAAWVAQPNTYQSWLQVDTMARLSVGMSIAPDLAAQTQPTWILDSAAAAGPLTAAGGWDGPTNFGAQFQALWGVG